jgi:hypothetical protein
VRRFLASRIHDMTCGGWRKAARIEENEGRRDAYARIAFHIYEMLLRLRAVGVVLLVPRGFEHQFERLNGEIRVWRISLKPATAIQD